MFPGLQRGPDSSTGVWAFLCVSAVRKHQVVHVSEQRLKGGHLNEVPPKMAGWYTYLDNSKKHGWPLKKKNSSSESSPIWQAIMEYLALNWEQSLYLVTCLYILSILVAINSNEGAKKLGSSVPDKVLRNNSKEKMQPQPCYGLESYFSSTNETQSGW